MLRFSTENIEFLNAAENYTSLTEIPFNSKNKWMMKLILSKDHELHNQIFGQHADQNVNIMLLKGAPDILLRKCDSIIQSDGSSSPMDDNMKLSLIKQQNDWCILGQRVLLLCKREFSSEEANELALKSPSNVEKYVNELTDCCLIGMVGIIDPPREGMSDVISKCRTAGIRVFMVTGDYALTAAAIATQIGIFTNGEYDNVEKMREKHKEKRETELKKIKIKQHTGSLLLTGSEIEKLTDDDWRFITTYEEIVLARTTPEQKLTTVKQFRKDDYIVAVTGDGVNDAPALKNADIGIAMGSGSEVAMEAAQMVLLDSSFTSILVAIENGRLVFYNLRKVILYLLPAGSFAELVPILVNIFLGVPLPLSAFLMICICILTDMAPALSVMCEKPEQDLLKLPPRSKKDHLVDARLIFQAYFFIGMLEAILSHCVYFWYWQLYAGLGPSKVLLCFDKCTPTGNNTYNGFTGNQLTEFMYTGQTITFIGIKT
jgi:sodium/potassium-transporting ATPase subunit alpha